MRKWFAREARLAALMAAVLAMYSAPARADFPAMAGIGEEAELSALLSILEVETEIATNTKMNADYVPGIVTVLEGRDMIALGARTVWEALRLSPGLEITINNHGAPLVLVRGAGYELLAGQVMAQLNGIPVNRHVDGFNLSVMMLPIEQVERIEIIRGPGSVNHGGYAYMGVINVVTRKGEDGGYVTAGSFDTYGGGVMTTFENAETGLSFSLNAGYWQSEGPMLDSGPDDFLTQRSEVSESYSPGPVDERERFGFGSINLSKGGFSLLAQTFNNKKGPYFGVRALHPVFDEPKIEDRHSSVRAQQDFAISQSSRLEVYGFYRSDVFKDDLHLVAPPQKPGAQQTGAGPGGPGAGPGQGHPPGSPDGTKLTNYYEEGATEGGLNYFYEGLASHKVFMGLSYGIVSVVEARESSNVVNGGEPYESVVGKPDRTVVSVAVQDEYEASDQVALTLGARYDSFDDVGSRVTPRVAAVWRAGGPHILKAQYAQSYRPPSFYELYAPQDKPGRSGNPDLKPELSDSYELAYTYKSPGFTGRAVAYNVKLKEYIRAGEAVQEPGGQPDRRLSNTGSISLSGMELEGTLMINAGWKTRALFSFNDAKWDDGSPVAGSASWSAAATLIGELVANVTAGLNVYAVGERNRDAKDTRDILPGYTGVDLTLSAFNVSGVDGLTLRAGGKNITDADTRAPSLADSYPNDLPRPGATWFAEISYTL